MSYTHRLPLFLALMLSGLLVTSLLAAHPSPQNRTASPPQNKEQTNAPPATPGQESVVRISTQLVQIDAVVTDKKDQHVDDLNENDFELLVDGRLQTLTHFALVRAAAAKREASGKKESKEQAAPQPIGLPGKPMQPEQVRRTIAFVVDDLGMSPSSMHFARQALKKFVEQQMQEGDLVGIIRTGRGIGSLQQFTSDRRILDAAIEKMVWNPMNRAAAEFGVEFGGASSDEFENFRESIFSVGTLGAMNFVVRGLRELPGRKVAILMSDGFRLFGGGRDNFRVLEQVRRLVDLANRSSVVIYSLDSRGLEVGWPNAADGRALTGPQLSERLGQISQRNFELQDGLVYLARETGGLAMLNNNDLNAGVRDALRDSESYYLLGFDPEDHQFDRRYHAIKVRIKRPGLRVRTRAGFFGVADKEIREEPHKTRQAQILSALYSPFGARDLKLQMTSFFFNLAPDDPHVSQLQIANPPKPARPTLNNSGAARSGSAQPNTPSPNNQPRNAKAPTSVSFVRSLFHIDCSPLTFKDGENGQKSVTLDLAAFAFNEEGTMVDQHGRTFTLSFDQAKYRLALVKGILYVADIPIRKPGAYQFRAVLRDSETGRMGSATQFLQIPDLDKKQLALSGLVLSAPQTLPDGTPSSQSPQTGADANKQPPATNQAAPSAEANDAQPTPAVRRFARTGEIAYNFIIFNAQLDKQAHQPQLTAQVELFRDGKRTDQFPARPVDLTGITDFKRLASGGRLQMKDFPPGDYVMRIIVTDALAKQKHSRAEQWMDFSVR